MNQQSGLQPIVAKFVNQYQKQLQISLRIALLLFGIGIILGYSIAFNYLAIIGGILSALLFFIFAFRTLPIDREGESESVLDSYGMIGFLNRLNYIALSISSMAVLFTILQIKGGEEMRIVGGLTILIISFFHLFLKQKPNGYIIKTELILTNLIFLITILLFILQ